MDDNYYREQAINLYQKGGECEIDSNAVVSRSEDGSGAYVQAWVWVETPFYAKEQK